MFSVIYIKNYNQLCPLTLEKKIYFLTENENKINDIFNFVKRTYTELNELTNVDGINLKNIVSHRTKALKNFFNEFM